MLLWKSKKEQAMDMIYQFKISVKLTTPIIWRRIHVPSNYTMHQLHAAIVESVGWCDSNRFVNGPIRDSMAWFETNLYQFDMQNGSQVDYFGLRFEPSFYEGEENIKCAMCVNISDVFKKPKDNVLYYNDFRHEWTHEVMLQRILPKSVGFTYPRCVAGSRCCPPNYCKTMSDYRELLDICERRDQRDMYGNFLFPYFGYETFDPDKFSAVSVRFISDEHRYSLNNLFLPSVYCYETCREENHPSTR